MADNDQFWGDRQLSAETKPVLNYFGVGKKHCYDNKLLIFDLEEGENFDLMVQKARENNCWRTEVYVKI